MTTTEQISPPAAPLAELTPLVGAIAGEGPPVIFLAGPWLFLGLMLAGPFAFLVTLVVAMVVAAAAVAALVAAIVGPPYVLVHAVRDYRARRESGHEHAAPVVPVRTTGAIA